MTTPIDKRQFLAAVACRTRGWLGRAAPRETPSPGLALKFHTGNEIHRLAREFLGAGSELQRSPLEAALAASQEALADPSSGPLLYEVSFQTRDSNFVARTDALRRQPDGWTIVEVKSGVSPNEGEGPNDEYVDDLAYSWMVATNAGLAAGRAELVVINREYRLDGAVPLLTTLDVTDAVRARAAEFARVADSVAGALQRDERPEPEFSFTCKGCDYFGKSCLGVGVKDHLFRLPRLSEKKFDELAPFGRVKDIPHSTKLAPTQQLAADVIRSGVPLVQRDGLAFLDELRWPLYFLDFEASSPAIPWFAECPPYDATPFQYSLDVQDAPDTPECHFEYLAHARGDWRRELTERLIAELGSAGSIIVYSSYEKTRLSALAALFDDLKPALDAAIERLFDLERVFKKGYIHPDFAGSSSIKKVLPAVVPALSYDALTIGNGTDAAAVFEFMYNGEYPTETHESHRANLLRYCGLDTNAMVLLLDAVRKLR